MVRRSQQWRSMSQSRCLLFIHISIPVTIASVLECFMIRFRRFSCFAIRQTERVPWLLTISSPSLFRALLVNFRDEVERDFESAHVLNDVLVAASDVLLAHVETNVVQTSVSLEREQSVHHAQPLLPVRTLLRLKAKPASLIITLNNKNWRDLTITLHSRGRGLVRVCRLPSCGTWS